MEQVTSFLSEGTYRFYEEIMIKLIHSENAFIEKLEQIKESFLHYWTELDNITEFCVLCIGSTHMFCLSSAEFRYSENTVNLSPSVV
jgi:hypothetical protein